MESTISEIVAVWEAEQAEALAPNAEVRFVLEHVQHNDPAAAISGVLPLQFSLTPLFEGDRELQRFLLLTLPRIQMSDRADLFEVANALRAATAAATVEPDLSTNYYQDDVRSPDPDSPESANWAFWCWAKQLPMDPDWAVKQIRATDAWDFSRQLGRPHGGQGIVVFQPDTGVVATHTALPSGVADDPRAGNFVEPGNPPIDLLARGANKGHGTGTGSVVVGRGTAMRGSAPEATLIPIRCTETVAILDQSKIARAVEHAWRNGAHVITMSLGGVPSRALHAAIKRAVDDQIIVVAAAGNCVGEVVWPARYAEVIALAGTNDSDQAWRGSCRGAAVAVSAPAEFVQRADGNDPLHPPARVSGGQGTSFAAALTAGIAALWLAHHGRDRLIASLPEHRTLQEAFRRLLARSARAPAGYDRESLGAGIVDALELLKLDPADVWDAAERAQHDNDDSIRTLLEAAFGRDGAEAAIPVLEDPQYHAELASVALDRLRTFGTPRAQTESPFVAAMSPSLRSRIHHPLTV